MIAFEAKNIFSSNRIRTCTPASPGGFGVKFETCSWPFFLLQEAFVMVFLSKTKSQRPWRSFGVNSKHLFYASDLRLLQLCVVLGFVVVKKSMKYSTKILLGSRANDALPAAKWPPLLLLIGFQVWHFETAALLCNSSDARKSVKLALMHQCTAGLCIVQIFGKKKKESHWYWFRIWENYISKELNPKVFSPLKPQRTLVPSFFSHLSLIIIIYHFSIYM